MGNSTLYILKPGITAPAAGSTKAARGNWTHPSQVEYVKVQHATQDVKLQDQYKGSRFPNQGGLVIGTKKFAGQIVIGGWFSGNLKDVEAERVNKFMTYMLIEWKKVTGKLSLFYWNKGGDPYKGGTVIKDTRQQIWNSRADAYTDYYGVVPDMQLSMDPYENTTWRQVVFDLYMPFS